ncbi:ATP-binding cassette domain-containing protein [Actinomadura sp. 1N219]|uniref:branched-chain amino acid ABC transporter ATP-binding protein/permease n=1 Tax=Actinomadura sp. 1N219 TaxID=3375152 RepID=UPI003791778F
MARGALFAIVTYLLAFAVLAYVLAGEQRLSDAQLVGQAAAFLLATLGLNLLVGNAGMHSFGQGAFFGIGAYTFMYSQLAWHAPTLVSFVLAVALPGLLGVLTAAATARMRGPQLAMVTLILAVVVQRAFAEAKMLGQFGGYPSVSKHGTSLLKAPSLFGITLEPPLFGGVVPTALIFTVLLAATCLIGYRRLSTSPWGRSLATLKESDLLAAHLGINVLLRKVSLLALTSGLAGLGGACYALVFAHLQPESFTLMLGVNMIIMVILGGSGTVLGPVLGTVIIVYLQTSSTIETLVELQNRLVGEKWYLSAQGLIALIMLVVIFVLPMGIVGSLSGRLGRLDRRGLLRAVPSTGGPRQTAAAPAAAPTAAPVAAPAAAPAGAPATGVQLAVEGISRSFGGVRAARDVSFTVEGGAILALVGPNGAGKSTVVNVVSGVYPPDEGRVVLAGADVSRIPAYRRSRTGLARTFQRPLLAPELTVAGNVATGCASTSRMSWISAMLPSRLTGHSAAADRARVSAALELVGLADMAERRTDELSYGQLRMTELARAVVSGPRVLLLDEPAAGLNETETAELAALLRRLCDDGLAIVLVEHHMDLVRDVADEVLCLIEGAPLLTGTPDQVLGDPRVAAAYLGDAEPARQGADDA